MKLLNHTPLKSKILQFVGWVMVLSLGQVPANIGDDTISSVIMGLVEDSPRPDPQVSVCSLKGLAKSVWAIIATVVHRCFSLSEDCWHLSS